MNIRSLLPIALLSAGVLTSSLAAADPADLKSMLGNSEIARCSTVEPTLSEMEAVAQMLKARQLELGTFAVGGQIKVAWHVIYFGTSGNIPQSQIDASIDELNKAFSGFYGGANTGYTFVLSSVDRTSNRKWFGCTPGSGAESQMKNALAIDPARRLNIYSNKPGQNLLGWAVFPWSYPETDKRHGVVIHYQSVPGGTLSPYNLGGTLDHEVGHYLGLYHTFQGGCTAPGDQVDDTPYQGTSTSGCPEGKDTCPAAGLDPIHNYMDYSYDACYTQFTAGQDARMDAMVPAYRPSLLNAAVAQAAAAPPAEEVAGSPITRTSGLGFAVSPSPFSRETRMSFILPRAGHTTLKVYNVTGQLVETLANGEWQAGEHSVTFHARSLPAGMYFTRLQHGSEVATRSIILVP